MDTAAGIESFDHSTLGALPEYTAAQDALDALAQALNRLQREGNYDGDRDDWLDMVQLMAAALPYSDACQERDCHRTAAPFKVELNGDWLRGTYWCPNHRRTWTCGYAVDTGWMAGLQ